MPVVRLQSLFRQLIMVQRIVDLLGKDGYRARTLIREIALSAQFRNTQGGVVVSQAAPGVKRSRKPLLGEK